MPYRVENERKAGEDKYTGKNRNPLERDAKKIKGKF
jgi:hypothetical protein